MANKTQRACVNVLQWRLFHRTAKYLCIIFSESNCKKGKQKEEENKTSFWGDLQNAVQLTSAPCLLQAADVPTAARLDLPAGVWQRSPWHQDKKMVRTSPTPCGVELSCHSHAVSPPKYYKYWYLCWLDPFSLPTCLIQDGRGQGELPRMGIE